jgi:hypothetical protein
MWDITIFQMSHQASTTDVLQKNQITKLAEVLFFDFGANQYSFEGNVSYEF